MSPDLRKRFFVIFAVIIGCFASIIPINKRINLGLELRGGMHLVLKVQNENLPTALAREDAVLKSMEVLRNRIDGLGVGETLIQRQGDNQILVQLPGVTDRDKALEMVGRVAHLEFHLVDPDESHLKDALAGHVPDGDELMVMKKENGAPILIFKETAMGGEGIKDARVDFDRTGMQPKISMAFNEKGTKDFGDLTTAHVNERLAIVLDNEVLSAPNIREPILTGDAEITGDFKFEEASLLALALRTGALPVPMHIEEERTIGPLLGKDSIEAGIRATILGGVLIVVFMSGYYLLGGIIASLALTINLLMVLGGMGLLNILMPDSQMTLTLPGIAGIILTLGMAVDANVLINERIREEIDNGRPLTAAINTGYSRALAAIIDSHVTSLIAGVMLFQFGSGPIKGFAVTLTIGLLASLLTSIFITQRGAIEKCTTDSTNTCISTIWTPRPNDPELEAAFLARTSFPDGSIMLAALHTQGRLIKVGTSDIEMTPTTSGSIVLSELNQIIAEQRGVPVDDLSIKSNSLETKPAPVTPTEAETIAPTVTASLTLTPEEQAKQFRSDADRLSKQAAELRRQAEALVPTAKKTKVTTES